MKEFLKFSEKPVKYGQKLKLAKSKVAVFAKQRRSYK